jgi:hypothetical protein
MVTAKKDCPLSVLPAAVPVLLLVCPKVSGPYQIGSERETVQMKGPQLLSERIAQALVVSK